MPELPEVETTVRGLARYLDGERIERAALHRPDMRFPFPEGLVQALSGARVTGLGRRAKYGLVHTDRGSTLVFHLGMSGRWRIDPDTFGKHDRSGRRRKAATVVLPPTVVPSPKSHELARTTPRGIERSASA